MTDVTQAAKGSPILLVTGGSRGIGAAIVRLAAESGYEVAFSFRENSAAAEALRDEVAAKTKARCAAVRSNVGDSGSVTDLFEQVEDELGPVTALVNNAGITGRIGSFLDCTRETMREVADVNLLGTMYCAQEAVRRWTERDVQGAMVNISSIASTLGAPGEYVHYAATKAAVESFSIGLGKELAATGIRVNAVAPGTVYTDIHATAGEPGRPARVVSRIPMNRIGQPEEIAKAVLWLLSDESSYVTGTVLRVSGGL